MLSLLVARWPGSRSASLCFVAWLEFGTPWHLACCPGRQPGHRLFFEVRSIGKQMVGWKLREYRLCLGDFCQLWLFWQQMIFGWFWPILSATLPPISAMMARQREVMNLESRLATLAPRWVPFIGRRTFLFNLPVFGLYSLELCSNASHKGGKNSAS